MTIIAAIAAGNALAWMIHGTTWWLRRHCLWLMVLIGVPCVALAALLSLFYVESPAWAKSYLTPAQIERDFHQACFRFIIVWASFVFVGWLHAPQLREGRRRSVKLWLAATLCAFAEAVLALWLGVWGANKVVWPHSYGFWSPPWFGGSLAVTLLLLALLRPLVVRVGKLLSEMLGETFRWSRTPT